MQNRANEIHLLDYWRIINSKRHIVISFFTLIVGVVAVYSFAATPVYQSTAKLLVNMENNTTLTFSEGSPQLQFGDPVEYYNTQKKILMSRTFMDRVVRKYSLDESGRKSEAPAGMIGGGLVSTERMTSPALDQGEVLVLDADQHPWVPVPTEVIVPSIRSSSTLPP
jgi:uncharacterized protein involved in exopolysaccharide biosynthesis